MTAMKVLLTNDDGIQATGLNAARRALLEVPDIELTVIAPDSNRSATARSITTREPLWVEEVDFGDGSTGFATDGTPVDCVRFAALGLVESEPELIVSGINHGSNLGDDITYSGTVAAALEGIVLGVPAIAVSQQSARGELDFRAGDLWQRSHFEEAATLVARLVDELADVPVPERTLLNINCPAAPARGVRACRLGKRIYRDRLELSEERDGRRRYRIYGEDPSYHDEPGTDFEAVADGYVSVTPLHFDLTATEGVEALAGYELDRLLGAAEGEEAGPVAGRSRRGDE
jgi:5'-nucleotidase